DAEVGTQGPAQGGLGLGPGLHLRQRLKGEPGLRVELELRAGRRGGTDEGQCEQGLFHALSGLLPGAAKFATVVPIAAGAPGSLDDQELAVTAAPPAGPRLCP